MAAPLAWLQRTPLVLFLSLFVVFLSSVVAFEGPILDTGELHSRLSNRLGISFAGQTTPVRYVVECGVDHRRISMVIGRMSTIG